MRISLTILFLGLLISKGQGQTSEKRHVFSQNDKVYHEELDESTIRFTPEINEINTADSLAEIHIKKSRRDYGWTTEISDYKSYYRQYVGYLNEKNERIILINSICRLEENWTKNIVSYRGGGSCYFEIKVNVKEKEPFDFNVNAPK